MYKGVWYRRGRQELLEVQHSMMIAKKKNLPTVTTSSIPQQFTTTTTALPMQQAAAHNLVSSGHQQVIVGVSWLRFYCMIVLLCFNSFQYSLFGCLFFFVVQNNQQIITEVPVVSNGLVMSVAPRASNILLTRPSNYITYAQHPQPEPQHEQKLFLQQY